MPNTAALKAQSVTEEIESKKGKKEKVKKEKIKKEKPIKVKPEKVKKEKEPKIKYEKAKKDKKEVSNVNRISNISNASNSVARNVNAQNNNLHSGPKNVFFTGSMVNGLTNKNNDKDKK